MSEPSPVEARLSDKERAVGDDMRVWVAPDGYDNPTIWTDGPSPDFPRALLVRVPSNADLFDWIARRADHQGQCS